jgi:hypothetical protein
LCCRKYFQAAKTLPHFSQEYRVCLAAREVTSSSSTVLYRTSLFDTRTKRNSGCWRLYIEVCSGANAGAMLFSFDRKCLFSRLFQIKHDFSISALTMQGHT